MLISSVILQIYVYHQYVSMSSPNSFIFHRPVKLKFSDDTDIPLERNNSLHIPPRASDSLLSTSRKYEGVIVKSSDKIENHTESISSREKRLSYRDKFNDSITNNMLINNIKELSKRMTFYEIESTL